jgi:hypothetical protein
VNSEGTLVGMTIPYPLIWDSDDLEIRVEDKVFKVHFGWRYRQEGDAPVIGGRIIYAPGMEWPQDRLGRVVHTTLEILSPTCVQY